MQSLFVVVLILAALLAWIWGFYLWQRRAIRRGPNPPEPSRYPSLSVIRPVKGNDHGMEENLRAAFRHGYPGDVEILFVLDDANEPSLPLIEEAIATAVAEDPAVDARILFCGHPPLNRTGKLNAMILGLAESRHELVAFVDSDIRQDADDLRILTDTLLADERAGSAFSTVISTATPRTAGDVGYALMLNGLYEPAALATGRRFGGELPFIMGHIMILQREAIQAIGGLECAEGQLVDDMYLGRRLHQLGYRNKMSPKPAAIIQQDLSIAEFRQILVRWVAFSMSGLPLLSTKLPHLLSGIAFWAGLLVCIVAAINRETYLAGLGLLLPISAAVTINDLHYRMSGSHMPWRYWWGAWVLWLSAPWVYARIWMTREIDWRGRPYRLDGSARLRSPGA